MRLCSLVWNTIIFIVFWAFQLLISRRDSSDSLLSVLSEPPKLVMKSFIVSKSTSTSARLLASAYCKLLESLLSILRAPKSHLCDTAHHYLSSFSWLLPVFTEILLWSSDHDTISDPCVRTVSFRDCSPLSLIVSSIMQIDYTCNVSKNAT
ncbi:hypothetical protein ABG067_006884 [Albugo candida]